MTSQIIAITILLVFYGCYFSKMISTWSTERKYAGILVENCNKLKRDLIKCVIQNGKCELESDMKFI